MSRQRPAISKSPDPALAALLAEPRGRPVLLLHSGRPHPRWATRSLLARPTTWYRYTAEGTSIFDLPSAILDRDDAAASIRSKIEDLRSKMTHRLWTDLRTILHHPDLPGPWFGHIGYDVARCVEPTKLAQIQQSNWPIVQLGYCPPAAVAQFSPIAPKPRAERSEAPHVLPLGPRPPARGLAANFTRAEYEATVRRALDYIAAGDVFQVNLAQQFTTQYGGEMRELFARLATVSPAWYGAYVELPIGDCRWTTHRPDRALLSTSPELFLEMKGRHVVTRPIKGTRGQSTIGNPQSAIDELRSAPKDTAELNMIIDLLRNDLGRVCSYGSVRVERAREIETHPTVHHATATIAGELHEDRDVVDLLRATLPGGSITGAPKVRAMQIIDELERGPRGPYCGCIGYLSRDEVCLNIAIRTMTVQRAGLDQPGPSDQEYNISFHVGGGIVADSDPATEYDETIAKAQAMLRALGAEASSFS